MMVNTTSNSPNNKRKTYKRKIPISLLLILLGAVLTIFIYNAMVSQCLRFEPTSEPLLNPLMGWAPWATIRESQQAHSLVYADLTWRDFEPSEGSFDFTSFEERNQLARWCAEGKRVVFRFVLDRSSEQDHMDIPDWLFEKMNGQGDFYDNEYGKGFSPDYSNEILIKHHQKAMQALGERYGLDGFFAYIELGSLGHWGEWHVHSNSNIRPLPNEEIRNRYVQHYQQAFPNSHLLMRRPFNIAAREHLGLYNDMTADFDATTEWLDWVENGGEYSQTGEPKALAAMPGGWQKAPIGGEQTQSMSDAEIYDQYLAQTIALLKASHATFVGPSGPYDIPEESPLQQGIDQVLSTLGYRLLVSKAFMPKVIYWGKHVMVRLVFTNEGIAPFYYNWPAELVVMDENKRILAAQVIDMDIREVLPGLPYRVKVRLPIEFLEDGTYDIGVAIIDPLTQHPAVQWAVSDQQKDYIQELCSIKIKRFIL